MGFQKVSLHWILSFFRMKSQNYENLLATGSSHGTLVSWLNPSQRNSCVCVCRDKRIFVRLSPWRAHDDHGK